MFVWQAREEVLRHALASGIRDDISAHIRHETARFQHEITRLQVMSEPQSYIQRARVAVCYYGR